MSEEGKTTEERTLKNAKFHTNILFSHSIFSANMGLALLIKRETQYFQLYLPSAPRQI